jgi:hypothetical protein
MKLTPEAITLQIVVVVVIFLSVAFGMVGNSDYEEEVRQHEEACEMHALFKSSNEKYGWPNYNDRDCS